MLISKGGRAERRDSVIYRLCDLERWRQTSRAQNQIWCVFFSSGRAKSINSDLLLEHDPPLVTERLLCQPPGVTDTQLAPLVTCGAARGVLQIPEAPVDANGSLGQRGQGILSRTRWQVLCLLLKLCKSTKTNPLHELQGDLHWSGNKQTNTHNLNTFSACLSNTLKMSPSSFPCVTAAVKNLLHIQKCAVSNMEIYTGSLFKLLKYHSILCTWV